MAIEAIDKRVLIGLLRDGRASIRELSRYTGLSPQLISYKLRAFISRDIIKSFSLRISPNLYGYYYGFVAVDSKINDFKRISSWASCLEKIELLEIYSSSLENLGKDMEYLKGRAVSYYMSYIPPQRLYRRSRIVDEFIRALRSEPRASFSRLAEISGLERRSVIKIYRWLKKRRLVRVIPILDLDRAGIKLVVIFTRKADKLLLPVGIEYEVLLHIAEGSNAFFIIAFIDSYDAKKFISEIRGQDREVDIMIIYDYGFLEIE
ncbi:MAG: winged helix-turn-helix transcriptional regulator [Sulfolobales archaeon]